MKLITLLQIAGALHLGLAWAGATMPKAVNLREHLAALPPFIRRLFWVYFTFIGLTLLSFGGLTFFYAPAMASGEPLARALRVFLATFWILRLIVAVFVFDVRPQRQSLARTPGPDTHSPGFAPDLRRTCSGLFDGGIPRLKRQPARPAGT